MDTGDNPADREFLVTLLEEVCMVPLWRHHGAKVMP
jgi:hypothetical protein